MSTRVLAAAALAVMLSLPAAKVACGLTVYADEYGYDPVDATDALQAAINSGADTVIVRDMGSPWYVRPMQLASDQHIIFQSGVEIAAKPGAFPGTSDRLFTANGVSNLTLEGYGATFRMNKSEYVPLGGEWRHGLALYGCSNVSILGLKIRETGGDGIYISSKSGGQMYSSYIYVKDVVCDKNYRQGMSVISVDGLLVENCVFKNTSGTPPQSGVDFEPNNANQRLANIDLRNVTMSNNAGWGMLLYAAYLNDTSKPVSVTVTNSSISGTYGVGIYDRSTGEPQRADAPTGKVTLRGVNVSGTTYVQGKMQIAYKKIGYGDANEDGVVDVADLGILGANYGMSMGGTWNRGDFNGDRRVDLGDLAILGAHYGGGTPPEGGTTSEPLPEPATFGLLAVGGLALIRRRRR